MNRHTFRLLTAIAAAWLLGGLAGTPLVPYSFYLVVFFLVFLVPVIIVFVAHQGPRDDVRPRSIKLRFKVPSTAAIGVLLLELIELVVIFVADWPLALFSTVLALGTIGVFLLPIKSAGPVGDRYRLGWLVAALATGSLGGFLHMFLFSSAVNQFDGERIRAVLVAVVSDGTNTECVLARPDGSRIAGALPVTDECRPVEDVYVSRSGWADPVRADTSLDGSAQLSLIILAVPLALAVVATQSGPRSAPRCDYGFPDDEAANG